MSLKVLDCTLRDGGYYNDWNFSAELVESYLKAAQESGIDMVELGFRNNHSKDFKGPYYFSTDRFLNSLPLLEGQKYGVMVDAKVLIETSASLKESVATLFSPAEQAPISFVRVAAHFHEIPILKDAFQELERLGYETYVNIMQISQKDPQEVREAIKVVKGFPNVNGLYFADSLGNLEGESLQKLIRLIRNEWTGTVGIHAHNNKGLALTNTISAISEGVELLDATVTGMGRGAGNAETEMLLIHLARVGYEKYKPGRLASAVIDHFLPLKKEKGWGSNFFYYAAADLSIHPTFVQKILSEERFGHREKALAFEYLPEIKGAIAFDEKLIQTILPSKVDDLKVSRESGRHSKSGIELGNDLNILGRENERGEVLIIGSGDSTQTHRKGVLQFFEGFKGLVLGVNVEDQVLIEQVQHHVISLNTKALQRNDDIIINYKSVVAPLNKKGSAYLAELNFEKITNYPLEVRDGVFSVEDQCAIVPNNNTAAYALAVSIRSGAQKIWLVGFDGYNNDDPRQREINKTFQLIRSNFPHLKLVALTPTTYDVDRGSIYAPNI